MTRPCKSAATSKIVNVRVSGALREHVQRTTSDGDYKSVSEYVRDRIRNDKAAREAVAFEKVKTALQAAFAEPRENYHPLTLERIRMQARADRS